MAWTIDKSRTKLEFAVRHMMIHTVRGTFRDYDAELHIRDDELTKSSVSAKVKAASVSTKDNLRDDYLASANFFNPNAYPDIEYVSTSTQISGRKISLSGRLKIRDREHPLILTGTVTGPSKGAGEVPRRLTFVLAGEIERERYDLVFHGAVETISIVVGKKVNLDLKIELVES